jgi:hypothetical protein
MVPALLRPRLFELRPKILFTGIAVNKAVTHAFIRNLRRELGIGGSSGCVAEGLEGGGYPTLAVESRDSLLSVAIEFNAFHFKLPVGMNFLRNAYC